LILEFPEFSFFRDRENQVTGHCGQTPPCPASPPRPQWRAQVLSWNTQPRLSRAQVFSWNPQPRPSLCTGSCSRPPPLPDTKARISPQTKHSRDSPKSRTFFSRLTTPRIPRLLCAPRAGAYPHVPRSTHPSRENRATVVGAQGSAGGTGLPFSRRWGCSPPFFKDV